MVGLSWQPFLIVNQFLWYGGVSLLAPSRFLARNASTASKVIDWSENVLKSFPFYCFTCHFAEWNRLFKWNICFAKTLVNQSCLNSRFTSIFKFHAVQEYICNISNWSGFAAILFVLNFLRRLVFFCEEIKITYAGLY